MSRAEYVLITSSDSRTQALVSATRLQLQLEDMMQRTRKNFDVGQARRLHVNVLNFKGSDLALDGQYRMASQTLRTALTTCQSLPDTGSRHFTCSRILHNLGKTKLYEGSCQEARDYIMEALNLRIGSQPPALSTLYYKGKMEERCESKSMALQTLTSAMSMCIEAYEASHDFCVMLGQTISSCCTDSVSSVRPSQG